MVKVVKQNTKPVLRPRSGSILDQLQDAWDMVETFSLLLYGVSGSGKSTLWWSWPKPILAIMISGGDRPGELLSVPRELRSQITARVPRESTDVGKLIEEAKNYASVVLDHGSGFYDLLLKEALGLEKLPEQKSWGMATREQYGQCTLQAKEYFRALLNLPCYRVIVAQERNFNDENNSDVITPTVGAALSPSLTGWLNPACDFILQTFKRQKYVQKQIEIAGKKKTVQEAVDGVDYCARTGAHPIYTTKFRRPKGSKELPPVIVDPDFKQIEALIKGE
jgi:hypothetical protein